MYKSSGQNGEDCDEFATSSCKAYTDVDDHVITLKAFGYEIPIGQSFRVTLNLNGIYLNQLTEGTSVRYWPDRYVEPRGDPPPTSEHADRNRLADHRAFHIPPRRQFVPVLSKRRKGIRVRLRSLSSDEHEW